MTRRSRFTRLIPGVAVLTSLSLLAAACGDDGGGSAEGDDSSDLLEEVESTTTTEPEGEGWTTLVYLVADNDLEPFALDDLEEMASVAMGENGQIIALVDRSGDYTDEGAVDQGDFEGTKLFKVGDGTMEELDDLGELNMGDPQTLSEFIARGIEEFPAAHYNLVLWDHGASWPGMGIDDTDGGDLLDLADLETAISEGLDAAGVDKLDMIGFDACLMATYEVAATLHPYADTLIASAELEPGHGWNYAAFQRAGDNPGIDPLELGEAILTTYADQAAEEETASDITLALYDLTKMPELIEAMDELSGALADNVDELAGPIGSQRERVLAYGRNPDPAYDAQMTDLGSLAAKLAGNNDYPDAVSEAADSALDALDEVVVDTIQGDALAQHTGMAIYFPPYQDYADDAYLELDVAGGWVDFLAAYFGAGQEIDTSDLPAFFYDLADYELSPDGLTFGAPFEPDLESNLIDATFSYGLPQADGTTFFFGQEPGDLSADGSGYASGFFDLTALSISDGLDTSYAYSAIFFDSGSDLFQVDVPLAYYSEAAIAAGEEEWQDVILSLVVSSTDGSIVSEVYYSVDSSGAYGELTADPNGFIYPLYLAQYADGTTEWVPTSDIPLYADISLLQYSFDPLPSGTQLYVELSVFDYGGNSDYVYLLDTVP